MAKSDPREFLLNTDYEMDKIIYFADGSLTLDGGYAERSIQHKLGFKPLVFGVCAFNEDFSDPRSLPYTNITQTNTIMVNLESNNSTINISYTNYNSPSSKVYYRIYAFEPSDSRAKIGKTSGHSKTFILNTDYNYCKLKKKGIVTSDTTIEHNLGYIPQVLAWQEVSGTIKPVQESLLSSSGFGIRVTNTGVIVSNMSTGIDKVHYRIYYDEA